MLENTPHSPAALRRFRIGVSALFFVNGAIFATWVSRIPAIKHELGLSEGELGIALLAMTVGAICAFPASAWFIARRGSRAVTAWSAALTCLFLPLAGFAFNLATLAAALALLGAALGAMDVAMNSQAVDVEKGFGRSIMVAFHGMWSLGGLVCAGSGSGLAALEFAPHAHFLIIAALLGTVTAFATPRLMPVPPHAPDGPVFALPSRVMLAVGLIPFCGAIVEGGIADWSGVYLRDSLGTSFAFAAFGFAAFSLTMTIGRFLGDSVVERFGRVRTLRTGAVLAAGALAVAVGAGEPWLAVAGFMLSGIGLSVVFPLAFTAAGRIPMGAGGTALPAVATMAYGGGLAGPPFIGFAAGATSLPVALVTLVVLSVVIAALAPAVALRAAAPVATHSPATEGCAEC